MDECEEGEILDFEDDDEVYRPLERPSHPPPPAQQRSRMVESESDEVTYSSSDTDSSSGPRPPKKRKKQRVKPPHRSRIDGPPAGQSGARIRKNNVWTSSVQEEAINELENLDGLQKFSRERGVESYDFTLNQERMSEDENVSTNEDSRHERDPDHTNDEMSLDATVDLRSRLSNKRRFEERGHIKQRLGRRPSPADYLSDIDSRLMQERLIPDLSQSASDSPEDIAKDMAKKLMETKEELILRIINTIGKEKAISLYEKTQKIESEGGMLTMNGSRRRSPGGVYFFLVKNDDGVSQQDKQVIFEEDNKQNLKEIRKHRKAARRKKVEDDRRKLADEIARNADLPSLLTRAELVVQQGTAINSKNTDGSVSNPPPSPATDNRGESSNDSPPHQIQIQMPTSDRNVANYDDDFLDVFGEDMDEF